MTSFHNFLSRFARFTPVFFLFFPVFIQPQVFVQPQVSLAQPIVQAVLFYSPSCPHCHDVMENVLPPLVKKYPNQLDIVGIDVSHPVGLELYQAAIIKFNIPETRMGVPTLIVANEVLVGTDEIEILFPQIIENGLAKGGFAWPDIPGLAEVLDVQEQAVNQVTTAQEPPPPTGPAFVQNYLRDPVANSIAVVVLVGMIVCAALVLFSYLRGAEHKFISFPEWLLPVAAILGFGIAFYMSYIELTTTTAVCGPIGDCNSVQESPYATLFGFLPVGVLGMIGYLAILIAWMLKTYGPKTRQKFFTIAIWAMAWFGVLFSIYLTFLEPFVIGAACVWCISSAIVITAILLFTTQPAKAALAMDDSAFGDDISDEEILVKDSL
ncbi:MAG: hypothetical protein B6D39_11055 [Anaerolineae bacterium UTCFX2]|jgi:uncharacterized membrane protein|nr:hypothetical protein [Anaerolineales bacterium]OQY88815.1 MAG: hypothetical protein B6D39_11055 [Anaerolineae bacterium UTCFX2]